MGNERRCWQQCLFNWETCPIKRAQPNWKSIQNLTVQLNRHARMSVSTTIATFLISHCRKIDCNVCYSCPIAMLAKIHLIAVLLTLFSTLGVGFAPGNVVLTTNGWVRGSQETTQRQQVDFVAFRGIPYAKPPLGELRLKVNLYLNLISLNFSASETTFAVKKLARTIAHIGRISGKQFF